jgi:ribosomal protein S18 acetylase RimI-like enzyme
MEKLTVTSFTGQDLNRVKSLIDHASGENYLSLEELMQIQNLSSSGGLNPSLLAWVAGELVGVRLSYPPGVWINNVKGLTPASWKVDGSRLGYFKSLFVAEQFRQQGVGKILSQTSLGLLAQLGARAVLCHSWLESPGNSSQLYLQGLGFEPIAQHARYWYDVDYQCVRCRPQKCLCTSVEMIKYL